MRFATENETYIIPLFFALTASYNYLKFSFSSNQKYAVYSADMGNILSTLSSDIHLLVDGDPYRNYSFKKDKTNIVV